jgi:hypothetical protein
MKDGSRSEIPHRWWEEGPLRIIELEEGYHFGEKMQLLRELEANAEHLTRFADPSIFPGVAFIDDRELLSSSPTLNQIGAERYQLRENFLELTSSVPLLILPQKGSERMC